MTEEIRGVTWNLQGAQLAPWQAVQRLYKAGFTDARVLAGGYAVMMAESGGYLEAWHHNVVRNGDGSINRDAQGRMTVVSTDLGFIQRNVPHSPPKVIAVTEEAAGFLADSLFLEHPDLAAGDSSAAIAWSLYQSRGWQPWYAHTNGSYKSHLPAACLAVGNFLDKVLTGASGKAVVRRPSTRREGADE